MVSVGAAAGDGAIVAVGIGVDSGAGVLVGVVLVTWAETVAVGSFGSAQAVMRSAAISSVAVASLLVREFLVRVASELNDFAV